MADEDSEAAPKGADAPEGVFGNLPSSRPGSRSPRRRDSKTSDEAEPVAETNAAASEPTAKAADKPRPKPKPKATPPPAREAAEPPLGPRSHEPSNDPLAPQPGIHGVEDLAWAGVAVVAQAATAGIRFTSRALDAARKSIDRP